MKMYQPHFQLLWLTAVLLMNVLQSHAVDEDKLVKTSKSLKVIPTGYNMSRVTKLVFEGSLITLKESDRLALASYPMLEELSLDDNLVTEIPAKYFAVVPKLRVLSLSRNKISRLHPESFSGLPNLTELDLSLNLLTGIHTQLFSRLYEVLNLQGNPWNCSCPLLSSTGEGKATTNTGGSSVSCASLESQAGRDFLLAAAVCDPSIPQTFNIDKPKPTTTAVTSQQPLSSDVVLKTSVKNMNHTNKDQKPALSNTWKFTVCVTALALCTSMVIMCAIKGPSWYKLLHDYRHRRLRQEEDEGVVSTVFTENRRYEAHQTFSFENQNGRIGEEGEEDGYFEDPYIRREDE